MTTDERAGRRLLVPLYAYPGTDREAWDRVAADAASVAGAVFNPGNGPGTEPQDEFVRAADRLRSAGVPLLGYVDTGYAGRAHREVVAEIQRYQEWYQVDRVFLDQVASARELLPYYRRLVVAARSLDTVQIVLNPGTHPDPGFAELADLLITFEGTWESYQRIQVPDWTAAFPPSRFGHLVHATPPEDCARVPAAARSHHAEICYATPGTGANPWAELMPQLGTGPTPAPTVAPAVEER